jgi:DNA-binding XRE family transcriptional regulator
MYYKPLSEDVMSELLRKQALARFSKPVLTVDRQQHFDFILKFVDIRLRKHITQDQLAKVIGTSQSVISCFESMKGNPSLKTLLKITEALQVRLTLIE